MRFKLFSILALVFTVLATVSAVPEQVLDVDNPQVVEAAPADGLAVDLPDMNDLQINKPQHERQVLQRFDGDIDHQIVSQSIITHSKMTDTDRMWLYLARSNLCGHELMA